jgi:hypothetical protein
MGLVCLTSSPRCAALLLYHFDRVFSHASQPKKRTVLKIAINWKRNFRPSQRENQNPEHPVDMVQVLVVRGLHPKRSSVGPIWTIGDPNARGTWDWSDRFGQAGQWLHPFYIPGSSTNMANEKSEPYSFSISQILTVRHSSCRCDWRKWTLPPWQPHICVSAHVHIH